MAGSDDEADYKRKYMRWSGELQDAYLDALDKCGGLHEARPKALLDMLQPKFPFLTLQNVKNHLQKQRTKEAKMAGTGGGTSTGGGGMSAGGMRSGARGRRGATPSTEIDGDDDEAMPGGEPDSGAAAVAAAAVAGVAPPRAGAGGPALWLPDNNYAAPMCDAGMGVQPNSLIDLAKRALALTVHQLALYRKLLEELELSEEEHTQLVAALRADPSGQSIVMDAQRAAAAAAAAAGGAPGAAGAVPAASAASAGSGSSEDVRPVRLRRLLARLLPPNPFSSGPKADAAMKLAAWISAVSRDAEAASASLGSHPLAVPADGPAAGGSGQPRRGLVHGVSAGLPPPGATAVAAVAAGGLGGIQPGSTAASGLSGAMPPARGGAAAAAAALEDAMEEEEDDMLAGMQPHRQQRRKRHKPLSELLAEIPLQEPLPGAAAAAPGVGGAAPAAPGGGAGAQPGGLLPPDQVQLGGAPATLLPGQTGLEGPPSNDALGGALSLLLQQHLKQQQAASGGVAPPGAAGAGGAAGQGMELDDDSLMLRALDAQMSSLLLQSVSNALMRSAQEGADAPMDGTGAGPAASTGGTSALPVGFDAAAALAGAGQLQLPPQFQDAAAAALLQGDEPLPTGALDISVLRSFLDMLSSGGLSPLTSTGLPHLQQDFLAPAPGGGAPAAAPGGPLSVGATAGSGSGGSGSGGSGGARSGGIGGGAFSAFTPTASGGAGGVAK